MKFKIYLFFLAFFYTLLSVGQGHYAISFSDKNNSTYTIQSPYEYLSAKAIVRRAKQNIPITTSDLPVNATYISTLTNLGATPVYASKWMNLVVSEIIDTSILNTIHHLPFVTDVQLIKSTHTLKSKKISNKLYVETTQELDYGSSSNQLKIMEGNFLHNLGFKGNGVTIAVLDAGFTNAHQMSAFSSLWNNNQILGFKDFVDGNDSVFVEHAHGTMVLSTMATNIPGTLVGTAPNANYYLLRTEDALTETLLEEYNWLVGAEFADSVGADIINSSLGYTEFDDTTQNHTYSDMNGNTTVISKAANWAAEKGILVVNSAGNSGNNNWKYIGAPADAPKILSIGAVDNDGIYASFSSQGPTSDGRIKPNVVAVGKSAAIINQNNEQVFSNGTSFSSPIMAGMMACLWQAFPNKTYQQLKSAVELTAHQALTPDYLLGYGIPNFRKAYHLLANIKDDNKNQVITIYPHPFNENFNITFYSTSNQTINIQLYDTYGKIILSEKWDVNENSLHLIPINGFQLSSGIYVLKINSSTKEITQKIIKQ